MPHYQYHIGGTRVPAADGSGHYEWPHDGAIIEIDHDTAAGLARIEGFREIPPDHPSVSSAEVRQDPPPDDESYGDTGDDDDADATDEGPAGTPRRRTRSTRRATVRE